MGIFHTILTEPLLNLLIWFYQIIPGQDIGLAIIAVTLLIRLLLFPSFQKSLRSQKQIQAMQPKLEEIKTRYKDDKEAQTKAILAFYKENKINPFSSCLPLLVQLPILIALYQVFIRGLNGDISGDLYPFISNPGTIDPTFLGFINLSHSNFWFALAAGLSQYWQSKLMSLGNKSTDSTARMMSMQFTYLMPLVTVFIGSRLPAGLTMYWLVTTLFAIGQQYYIMRRRDTNVVS